LQSSTLLRFRQWLDKKSLFDFLVFDNVENVNVVLASVLIAWDVVFELAFVAKSRAT